MPELVTRDDRLAGAKVAVAKLGEVMMRNLPPHLRKRLRTMQSGLYDCVKAGLERNANMLEIPSALRTCAIAAARLGLFPGTTMAADCHVLPFKNKRGYHEATFVPNYYGLKKLCYQSTFVASINCAARFEADEFQYMLGSEPFIHHRKAPGDRGELKGAWCVIRIRQGDAVIAYLTHGEIMSIRATAAGAKSEFSPWNGPHEQWMWAKSAFKAAAKDAPRSEMLALAHELDEKDTEEQTEILHVTGDDAEDVAPFEDEEETPAPAPAQIAQDRPLHRPQARKTEPAPEKVQAAKTREPGEDGEDPLPW